MDSRRAEILMPDVGWTEVSFEQLLKGDTFRLFESDGTPVIDDEGKSIFVATCDPYVYRGVWGINTKE